MQKFHRDRVDEIQKSHKDHKDASDTIMTKHNEEIKALKKAV